MPALYLIDSAQPSAFATGRDLQHAAVAITHGLLRLLAKKWRPARCERHPATAHLSIVNPLRGANLARLFATHPSTEERVRLLRAMTVARGMGAWSGGGAREAGPWGARRPV